MNRTIKLLMLSDIFILTGAGLVTPILAIFIKEDIIGGTIFAAGIASTIYLITKSIIQVPFARYVDRTDNKIKWLILGSILFSIVPFVYIFTKHIYVIYIGQLIQGIGSGLAFPTWLGLWSVNLDKNKESYEWSVYSTLTGLGTAATAAIGAAVAEFFGFAFTFALVGLSSLVGSFVLLGLEKKRKRKSKQMRITSYVRKAKIDASP